MKKVSLQILFFLVVLLLCASPLFSQSSLTFPRVIAATGEYTGLAVSNPTPAAVSITFTAYQADGTMAAGTGVQNPVTLSIPAGGQLAKQYGEIFGGNGSFNGWVQASSASTGLTGYFLNGNTALTDLDGAATVGAASDLMLPIAIEDGVAETEVTIVNANSSAATATVTVYGLDGGVIQTTSVSVAGMGVIRQTLSSLMGAGDYSAASHIRIQSALPLNALDVVVNYLVDGSAIRRETVEVPGQPASSGESYILPQFVTGGGWLSLIGLANGGGVSQTVTLTAYQENGTLWPGLTANPVQVTLPANGGIRTTAAEMFGFPAGTLNTGWIQVQSPLGYLSAYVGYGNTTTPSFGLVPAAEASTAWKYGVFPQVAEGGGFFTGLTLVNPGQTAATINFYTMRPDGTTVGESTFTLGAGQRVGELFREVLPAALGQVGGWGYVRSSQPLVGVSLLGTENGYALANVPEQGPPADFQPAAQTTGAITGTVTANGQAVAGVEITLTGPVTATVTTDASGDYIFSQLPAGTYQVTAVEPGAQFVPAAISVTLTAQNVTGQNFVAGGLTTANAPVVNVLSPASVFAGTSTLNIRVLGGNFTPTSVVLLNGQALQTSFINAGELDAILPAAQLTTAQTVNLTVMTPPPGGGQSGTVGLVVNPVPNDPLIVGRAATGGNPAGVAVDAKRLHALVTNESSDTVSVIDLKTLTSVATIGVGRSPAEGIAVDAARDIALVANPGTNDVSVIDLPTNTETKRISLGAGSFPLGIAIDDTVSRAFVADEGAGTVSVIDLNALAVVGTIAVGAEPSNVAVNTGTHMGLVTNRGSNTVTVFNTSALTVTGQLNVGLQPRGIAVNPVTNQAVIANSNGGDAWIVNLATLTIVAKVPIGSGPTGVAMFPLTNTAIVTNSGITKTQTNTGVLGSISIINLAADTISQQVTVGASAFGIDVDTADQQVVVADYGSNDVTVVRIPNPVPQVMDVEPKTFPAGGGTFTITIMGTGFLPTSVVTVNGQTLPTTYVSSTELQAQVSPDMLNQLLGSAIQQQTGKGQAFSATSSGFTIGVSNPGPGGGNSPPNSGTGQIQATNPVPVLLSISPVSITVGTGNLTLTLNGNNFNATSVVNFGGSQQSPVTVAATSMTVVIPQSSLSAGNVQVSVSNPAPGGGTSGALSFQVNGQSNPAPAVGSVTPSSIAAGSAATTVTVQGSGFVGTTTAALAGVSGSVSANTVTFNLSAAALAAPGTLAGLITTPAPGGGSASFSVNVLNPPPTVSGFSPGTAVAGTPAITLSVAGTNFGSGSQVTVAGTPIPTIFVSATQLSGTITASFLLHAGTLSIAVTNPAPGGGTAAAANIFTITNAAQAPVITAVSPASVTTGQPITITGMNFVPASTVLLNGVPLPTTENSPTQLTTTIPPTATAGTASITVQNPATSTAAVQTSAAFPITIVNPVPHIISITPATGQAGTTIGLTVTGVNFVNGATVLLGSTPQATTFTSSTSLSATATLPSSLQGTTASISVSNPGGPVSDNTVPFQITVPPPVLTGVSPNSAQQGQTNLSVSLTGQFTHFVTGITTASFGAGITVNNVMVASSTSATANITVTSGAAVGARNVSVTTGTEVVTSTSAFTVTAGTPVLTGASPNSGQQGQTNLSVSLTGLYTHFVQNTTTASFGTGITVNSLTVASATSATANITIPAGASLGAINVIMTTGTEVVTATNGFTVAAGTPVLTAVSPGSGQQGQTNLSVSLTGQYTHFVQGTTSASFGTGITVNNVTVGSATSATANITIASGAALGPVNVTATTGAEVAAATNSFTVTAGTPVLTAVSPNSGQQGQTNLSVGLTGQYTHFVQGTTTASFGTGITVNSLTVGSATSATANVTVAAGASLGAVNVTVMTGAEVVTVTSGFTVTAGTPVLAGVSPNSGQQGQTNLSVGLTGQYTHFVQGTTTASFGTGITVNSLTVGSATSATITVNSVTVGSATSATANVTVTAVAALGARNVTVTTGAEVVTATNGFTVTAGTPVLAGVSPNSGQQGQTNLSVSLTGQYTHFAQGTTGASFGTGITVNSVTVASATSAIANVTIASGAALAAVNVTVTTGTEVVTATNGFTVTAGTPVLAGVSPNSGQQGQTNLSVSLTGQYTHFVQGITTASFGTGITVNSVTVASATSATANVSIASGAALAAVNVTVTTGTEVVTATNGFTVTAGTPVLAGVSPNSGQQGQTNLSVSLTGQYTHFVQGITTASFGTGITVNSVTVASATSATANVSIASGAALAAVNVTVTTGTEVVTATNGFTVTAGTPVLAGVSPNSGQQGQTNLSVSMTGQYTHFVQGITTASFGTGITVNSVTVASATSATANVSIASGAALAAVNVTVTTGGEVVTATNGFTVTAGTPVLAGVSPNSGQQGQTNLSVSLTGQYTHFVQGITTASFGTGITVNSVTVASATSATANVSIASGAALAAVNVTVTTGTEVVTATNGFTVTAGTPVLVGVNPNSGQQGQTNLSVSLTGQYTHFVQGITTASFGTGITVNSVTVASSTSATANITIASGAALAAVNVTVTTGTEVVTATNGFTVTAGTPVLAGVSPNSGQQGQTNLSVSLTGRYTHFVQGITTASFGTGITVNSVTVASSTSATANVTIASGAALAAVNVTVTTGTEVVTATNGFTVTAGTPVLAGVSPNSGQQGQTNLSVSLTGQYTHFVQGITTASFGTGITVNSVAVGNATSAIANITVGSGAALGAVNVKLTTGAEVVTATNAFTVTAGTPALISVSPSSGQEGQVNLSVTLTGQYTHFVQGTTTAGFVSGITVNSVTVASATSATANITIAAGTTLGAGNVTVTTGAEVVTATNAFTVTLAPPLLDQNQPTYDTGVPFVFSGTPDTPNYPVAQSFTAGISGVLTQINVYSNGQIGSGGNLTLEIFSGDGVDGPLLGTVTQAYNVNAYDPSVGGYPVSVNVASLGIVVTAGNQYTFSFTTVSGSDFPTRGILASTSNPYAGGRAYAGPQYADIDASWDLMFGTYVDPNVTYPEFAGIQTGANQWTYTLTFAPLVNYSITTAQTTITLTGLYGVTNASGPTSTDFPEGSTATTNLDWSAAVLNGGTEVVFTHVGPGTGNFDDFRHAYGFTINASGAANGTVSVGTNGFSRDTDLPLPGGGLNLDITGTAAGPVVPSP